MIKNKVLDIRFILKIYLNILKKCKKYFKFPKKKLFYKKTVLKHCFSKLFSKTAIKHALVNV